MWRKELAKFFVDIAKIILGAGLLGLLVDRETENRILSVCILAFLFLLLASLGIFIFKNQEE